MSDLPRGLLRMKDLTRVGINNWPSLKRRVLNDNFPPGHYVGKSRVWTIESVEEWWKARPSAAPPEIMKNPAAQVTSEGLTGRDSKAPVFTPGYKGTDDSVQPFRMGGCGMGKRKRRGVPRFLSLHHRLLKSHAWHSLTPLQRCGYIEIAQLYDGSNNGRLAMSTRRLAGVIPCSKNSPILGELEDAGFIDTVRVGKYARNAEERLASEYRLTDLKCDVTGELPSRRYNERHRWEPSEPRPKRRPLSDAERAKRYRAQRHARHENRPSEWDGTAPVSGADNVTPLVGEKRRPRETAKNGVQKEPDVTKPAPPTGTLIHLTRGEGLEDTPIGTPRGSKPSLAQLAPGHSTCKPPKAQSLPPGWHWCRFDKCVVTNTGVRVPIVDHPLVGTSIERAALRFLEAWRGVGGVTLTPLGEAAAAILDSDTAAA